MLRQAKRADEILRSQAFIKHTTIGQTGAFGENEWLSQIEVVGNIPRSDAPSDVKIRDGRQHRVLQTGKAEQLAEPIADPNNLFGEFQQIVDKRTKSPVVSLIEQLRACCCWRLFHICTFHFEGPRMKVRHCVSPC